MSSAVADDLNNLTNDQLRSRLMQHGLANMPVTASTRQVLLSRLRKAIDGQKAAPRRETMHVAKHPTQEEKIDSKSGPGSKKAANRRNTVNVIPMTAEDVVPITKPKNMRRSGRITPNLNENGNSAPIAVPPSENDIIELDEEPVREVYVRPKRTSRSPSLGKSQTVVTSYKTEVAKPTLILESNEEDDDEEDEDEDESSESSEQHNLYPSLPVNGFKNLSPKKSLQSTLRRTTTHTHTYEPASYKPLSEPSYSDVFKAPLSRPTIPTYSTSSTSGLNRRYTTNNNFTSKRKYEEDSATEHSDIDAPYLSDFTKRLSQLRPEPLHRKIIADVKGQHHHTDNSLWQSFSNLVIAFGRKFGTVLLAGCILMMVVFIYVFFIMA